MEGIVEHLGTAAVCAIAQVLGMGIDICGLIEDLISIAEAIWDAATAVLAFFGIDLGEIWDALEGAYCATLGLIFGCDEDEGPPANALAFAKYFLPSVTSGEALRLLEAKPPANSTFCGNSDKPYWDLKSSLKANASQEYPAWACNDAANNFEAAVFTQWTGDVIDKAMDELKKKRMDYRNEPAVRSLAQDWWNFLQPYVSEQMPNTPVDSFIGGKCPQSFLDFCHVDRWIARYKDTQPMAQNSKMTWEWCRDDFWKNNEVVRGVFLDEIRKLIKTKCPSFDDNLVCGTKADFELCKKILVNFGQDSKCMISPCVALDAQCPLGENGMRKCATSIGYEQCKANINDCNHYSNRNSGCEFTLMTELPKRCPPDPQHNLVCTTWENYLFCKQTLPDYNKYTAGANACGWVPEIANKAARDITDNFRNCTPQCSIQPSIANNISAEVWCTRSVQQKTCESSRPDVQLVKCQYGYEDPKYAALRVKVVAAVTVLNGKSTKTVTTKALAAEKKAMELTISDSDPLLVITKSQSYCNSLQSSAQQDFGFGPPSSKPGFDYDCGGTAPGAMCGYSTPIIKYMDIKPDTDKLKGKIQIDPTRKNIRAGENAAQWVVESHGPGPIERESGLDSRILDMRSADQNEAVGAQNITVLKNAALIGAQIQGGITGQTGETQTQVMSGSMPGGMPVGTSSAPPPTVASPIVPTLQPDLTATNQVGIGGIAGFWNGTLTVDAGQARSRNNRVCEFAISYGIQNTGKSPAGTFRTSLFNGSVPGPKTRIWASLPVQGSKIETDILSFKTGVNSLQLTIDDMGQIQESNEGNNLFRMNVTVKGNCSAATVAPPPTVGPGSGSLPKPPAMKK